MSMTSSKIFMEEAGKLTITLMLFFSFGWERKRATSFPGNDARPARKGCPHPKSVESNDNLVQVLIKTLRVIEGLALVNSK